MVKKMAGQFEIQDKMRLSKASREIIEKRQSLMAEFAEYRKRMAEKANAEKKERMQLRTGELCYSCCSFSNTKNTFLIHSRICLTN